MAHAQMLRRCIRSAPLSLISVAHRGAAPRDRCAVLIAFATVGASVATVQNGRSGAKCDAAPTWDKNWDGLLGASSSRVRTTRHLLLVRHGQYVLNDPEHPLTELGREQARVTGRRLAAMVKGRTQLSPDQAPSQIQFSAVHSSDMVRARETGELIAAELKGCGVGRVDVPLLSADPLLAEGCPCYPVPSLPGYNPSAKTVAEDGERIEAAFKKYVRRATSETEQEAVAKRAASGFVMPDKGNLNPFLSAAEMPETYEVIACHGNVIRYFVLRALQLPAEAWLRTATYNCGITHIVISPDGRVSLHGFGDIGHLPPEQTTYH